MSSTILVDQFVSGGGTAREKTTYYLSFDMTTVDGSYTKRISAAYLRQEETEDWVLGFYESEPGFVLPIFREIVDLYEELAVRGNLDRHIMEE